MQNSAMNFGARWKNPKTWGFRYTQLLCADFPWCPLVILRKKWSQTALLGSRFKNWSWEWLFQFFIPAWNSLELAWLECPVCSRATKTEGNQWTKHAFPLIRIVELVCMYDFSRLGRCSESAANMVSSFTFLCFSIKMNPHSCEEGSMLKTVSNSPCIKSIFLGGYLSDRLQNSKVLELSQPHLARHVIKPSKTDCVK